MRRCPDGEQLLRRLQRDKAKLIDVVKLYQLVVKVGRMAEAVLAVGDAAMEHELVVSRYGAVLRAVRALRWSSSCACATEPSTWRTVNATGEEISHTCQRVLTALLPIAQVTVPLVCLVLPTIRYSGATIVADFSPQLKQLHTRRDQLRRRMEAIQSTDVEEQLDLEGKVSARLSPHATCASPTATSTGRACPRRTRWWTARRTALASPRPSLRAAGQGVQGGGDAVRRHCSACTSAD